MFLLVIVIVLMWVFDLHTNWNLKYLGDYNIKPGSIFLLFLNCRSSFFHCSRYEESGSYHSQCSNDLFLFMLLLTLRYCWICYYSVVRKNFRSSIQLHVRWQSGISSYGWCWYCWFVLFLLSSCRITFSDGSCCILWYVYHLVMNSRIQKSSS